MTSQPVEVVGAVIERGDKILCAQRPPASSLPNVWEFPGGKVEAGESHEVALAREVAEELGCVIRVGARITSTTHAYSSLTVRIHTYHCEITDGEPWPREHAQLRWLARADLSSLIWAAADIPTVQRVVDGAHS